MKMYDWDNGDHKGIISIGFETRLIRIDRGVALTSGALGWTSFMRGEWDRGELPGFGNGEIWNFGQLNHTRWMVLSDPEGKPVHKFLPPTEKSDEFTRVTFYDHFTYIFEIRIIDIVRNEKSEPVKTKTIDWHDRALKNAQRIGQLKTKMYAWADDLQLGYRTKIEIIHEMRNVANEIEK